MKPNAFAQVTNWLLEVETDFVRLITSLLPWAVPLVPSYIVYKHARLQMNYDPWIAWVMGVVTEGLGLASLVTSFKFWAHNRKYKEKKNQYPIIVPILTYVFYLAVVILINVVLDWQSGVDIYKIAVVALFSLLSLPAGLLLSVQTIFAEDEFERKKKKEELKQEKIEEKKAKAELQQKEHEEEKAVENVQQQVEMYLEENNLLPTQIGAGSGYVMTPKDLAQQIGMSNSGPVRVALSRLRKAMIEGESNER